MKTDNTNHRRKFIKQLSAGALAALTIPVIGRSESLPPFTHSGDEAYWEMVKKQFAVPENLTMMNAANLCPTTYEVNERVIEFTRALGRDVSFQYREVFAGLRKKSISMLSEFVGADEEEIGITRNTSESNCIVVQGLDFKAGDEIIIWDQNHPSNEAVWISRAKRFGFTVKKISVPNAPTSTQELVESFSRAITPKTKLISFSHISNLSGIALPAKEICLMAKAKGILTLVDGAQSLGMMNLDLHEMGCTFYSSSTHKWLMGPYENGILYINKENIHRIWPNVIGGGWKEAKTVDANICVLGQRNESTTAALPEILQFHNSIGRKGIEDRVIFLASTLKEKIQKSLPNALFVTPLSKTFSGGIVIINLPGKDPKEVSQKLYEKYGIASAASGGIRLSPHIYNTLTDLDKAVNALKNFKA